jgi:hypothetical protein
MATHPPSLPGLVLDPAHVKNWPRLGAVCITPLLKLIYLQRNIIIVIEDSDLVTFIPTSPTTTLSFYHTQYRLSKHLELNTWFRHNFSFCFLSPTVSPSLYDATTLPIYTPFFSCGGGRGGPRRLRWRQEAVEAVRGRARIRGVEIKGPMASMVWGVAKEVLLCSTSLFSVSYVV